MFYSRILSAIGLASDSSRCKNGAVRSLRFFLGGLVFQALLTAGIGSALAARVPWISNHVSGSPNPASPFTVERVYPRFTFEHPVEFAFMPGSDRLFVAEQDGKFWSFDASAARSRRRCISAGEYSARHARQTRRRWFSPG